MESISEATAQAFAQALISNHGNATAAARSLKYDDAAGTGHRYKRHPLVLKCLAPMAAAQLQSLTPQAIQTLGHLLNNGSPYVRLEAAKDVLDRNGVGTSREAPRSAQLVVNINLSPAAPADVTPVTLELTSTDPIAQVGEGALENFGSSLSSTSSAHSFSPEVSPAHDFSPEASQPLVPEEEHASWELGTEIAPSEQSPLGRHEAFKLELRLESRLELKGNLESRTKLEDEWSLGSE